LDFMASPLSYRLAESGSDTPLAACARHTSPGASGCALPLIRLRSLAGSIAPACAPRLISFDCFQDFKHLIASKRSLAHPVHKPLDSGEVLPHLTGDPPQQTTVLAAFLAAGVGQLVAVPAAEIASVWRQVQFAHSTSAWSASNQQRADEPPT
jgi:hypothetical protein